MIPVSIQWDPIEKSLTLPVPGDLVSTNVEAIREAALNLLKESDQQRLGMCVFKVDLSKAAMVDSAGLNLVVTLLKEVRRRQAQMRVHYLNPNLHRAFIFTRLDKHVELVKAAA